MVTRSSCTRSSSPAVFWSHRHSRHGSRHHRYQRLRSDRACRWPAHEPRPAAARHGGPKIRQTAKKSPPSSRQSRPEAPSERERPHRGSPLLHRRHAVHRKGRTRPAAKGRECSSMGRATKTKFAMSPAESKSPGPTDGGPPKTAKPTPPPGCIPRSRNVSLITMRSRETTCRTYAAIQLKLDGSCSQDRATIQLVGLHQATTQRLFANGRSFLNATLAMAASS